MEAVEHIVCPAAVLCKRLLPRQIPPRLGIWNEKLHCKQPGRTTGAFSEQQPSRGENQAATRVGNQSGKFYSPVENLTVPVGAAGKQVLLRQYTFTPTRFGHHLAQPEPRR